MQSTLNKSASIAGVDFSETTVFNASQGAAADPTVPAAQAGSLTTRTNNTVGTITMTLGGHTVITGARLDVYWTEGGVAGRRRGVVAGTVAGTSVPISGGLGDNLPSAAVAVMVCLPVKRPVAFVGANLDLIMVLGPAAQHSQVVFVDGADAELKAYHNQGKVQTYYPAIEDTNPFAGVTVANVYLSHNAAVDSVVKTGFLAN